MPSGVADYGAHAWLAALLAVSVPISGYWVALCTDEPGPAADGATVAALEPPAERNYRRVSYGVGAAKWAVNGAHAINLNPVEFPLSTGDWGQLTHFALLTQRDGGDLYAYGEIANPQTVGIASAPVLPPGGLVLTLASLQNSITT